VIAKGSHRCAISAKAACLSTYFAWGSTGRWSSGDRSSIRRKTIVHPRRTANKPLVKPKSRVNVWAAVTGPVRRVPAGGQPLPRRRAVSSADLEATDSERSADRKSVIFEDL